jgi:hypothetical protein
MCTTADKEISLTYQCNLNNGSSDGQVWCRRKACFEMLDTRMSIHLGLFYLHVILTIKEEDSSTPQFLLLAMCLLSLMVVDGIYLIRASLSVKAKGKERETDETQVRIESSAESLTSRPAPGLNPRRQDACHLLEPSIKPGRTF